MKSLFAIALTAGCLAGCTVAFAQVFPALPGLPEAVPTPLPPPQQAPIVNGPMIQNPFVNGSGLPDPTTIAPTIQSTDIPAPAMQPLSPGPTIQSTDINVPAMQPPSPGVLVPPPLNTFSDRTTQCLQLGASFGLSGPNLSTYSSTCANN
jgi:hypothetical protein